eukprot:SM000087S23351  [mRNA]  locus=s87:223515:226308:+ [translate_table: standard]
MADYGCSNFLVQWMNFLTMILSLPIIGLGIWLYTRQASDCEAFLQTPVIVIGAFIFVISLVGYVGARNNWTVLLWLYLVVMFVLILALLGFTIFAFIVTNGSAGKTVSGQGTKEYHLGDYSTWLRKRINDTSNWKHIRSCMIDSGYCDHLAKDYPTLAQYEAAKLSPTEVGCCRPPAECGFAAVNATYYEITTTTSTNLDCTRYSNNATLECFDCDSCKAGVANYLNKEWRIVAIVNLCILVVLIMLYMLACCARRNSNINDLSEFQRLEQNGWKYN